MNPFGIFRRFPDRGARIGHLRRCAGAAVRTARCGSFEVARKAGGGRVGRRNRRARRAGFDVPSGTVMRKTGNRLRKRFAAIGRPMPGRGRRPGRHRLRAPVRRRATFRFGRHPSRREPPTGPQVRDPNPKPFRWTKSADDIPSAVERFRRRVNHKCNANLNSGWPGSTATRPSPVSHIFRDPAIVGRRPV